MESERVVTKSERLADLLHRIYRGTATMDDRLEAEQIVLRSDGPTYAMAKAMAVGLRQRDLRMTPYVKIERAAA